MQLLLLHAPDRLLAIEVKATRQTHRTDARPLTEVLGTLATPVSPEACRLGVVVTRSRAVEPLAPGVRAIPDWRLFAPAATGLFPPLGRTSHPIS